MYEDSRVDWSQQTIEIKSPYLDVIVKFLARLCSLIPFDIEKPRKFGKFNLQ